MPFNETSSNITGVHAVMAEFVIDANSCINLRECARFSSKTTGSFDCVVDSSSLVLLQVMYEACNIGFDLAAHRGERRLYLFVRTCGLPRRGEMP
jgi:hypothetical protein